ncbi:hypothetical protein BDV38DRAFT_237684 [Aspergillus pseudotamarii]|uniref:Uncharacterized protein n=1 Tax=Aspergillus pseudotamarii TaxID=132259 RepID=A0A5N6T541_ASPPS|nr:uncharacterized protein BDV38DRAFT_237684 [Aspergillus pseudotamarii]KAE8141311.1 hypothetical protein BDV38DRAFT_237684 [Aspergillus pseudotamarii]
MVRIDRPGKPLTRLDVWSGEFDAAGKSYTVLRGIEAWWGKEHEAAGYTPDPSSDIRTLHDSFIFPAKNQIDWLDVYHPDPSQHGCVDSLRFHLPNGDEYFASGGFGGDKHPQVPQGKQCVLEGFDVDVEGREIRRLQPIFKK